MSNVLPINKTCLVPGIDQHAYKKRLTREPMTFALCRRGIERERLGGNYLIGRGVPAVINEPIWHPVQDHLKSSAAIWTSPMCQKCNNQHCGIRVTLSPRFKRNTWVFQITLVPQALHNTRHGASQRSGPDLSEEQVCPCRVETAVWLPVKHIKSTNAALWQVLVIPQFPCEECRGTVVNRGSCHFRYFFRDLNLSAFVCLLWTSWAALWQLLPSVGMH